MKLIVDGQLVNYQDEGEGNVIVLLHGWGADLQSFAEISNHLSAKYRLIRLDFPGFGGSPKPDDSWRIEEYARFVQSFLKKIDVKPYALVGHSFGGRVTIKAVANKYISPEYVILLGSAGVKPDITVRHSVYKTVAKAGKNITKLPGLRGMRTKLRRKLYESAGSTDYLDAEAMRPIFLNTINEDLQIDAGKITQPSLLIYGRNDLSTPVTDAEKLHQAIVGSKLVVVDDAAHYVFIDKPDETLRQIREFLK